MDLGDVIAGLALLLAIAGFGKQIVDDRARETQIRKLQRRENDKSRLSALVELSAFIAELSRIARQLNEDQRQDVAKPDYAEAHKGFYPKITNAKVIHGVDDAPFHEAIELFEEYLQNYDTSEGAYDVVKGGLQEIEDKLSATLKRTRASMQSGPVSSKFD